MSETSVIPDVNLREAASPLNELTKSVDLYLFTPDGCEACLRLEHFANELAKLSPQVHVHSGLKLDSEQGIEFQIDKHPAILIHGMRRYRLVYSGAPAGYEIPAVIELLKDASTGNPQVQHATRSHLEHLAHRVRIRVFVTPPCNYCPTMTRNTGKLAILTPQIGVEIIDAFEFPSIADASGVQSVPYTKLNDQLTLMEAVGEAQLVHAVLEASHLSQGMEVP